MKINFGSFELKVSRADGRGTTSGVKQISSSELKEINDSQLSIIRDIPKSKISSRIDAVSMDNISEPSDLELAMSILESEGILIVKRFLENEHIDIAQKACKQIDKIIAEKLNHDFFEGDEIILQSKNPRFNSYAELARQKKAVASIRQGADQGMIDVFNFDKLAKSDQQKLREPFEKQWLLSVLTGEGEKITSKNMNLYWNKGITSTRGFHSDAFKKMIKCFVYLSDVSSLDDGPYCYVKGSANDTAWRRANQAISSLTKAPTETPLIDFRKVVPVLAPKGSLVISDQAGFHRGIPQKENAERKVLVMAYY